MQDHRCQFPTLCSLVSNRKWFIFYLKTFSEHILSLYLYITNTLSSQFNDHRKKRDEEEILYAPLLVFLLLFCRIENNPLEKRLLLLENALAWESLMMRG